MRDRVTMFMFVLYVALDLSNPFHPGAFNFNPEECVEAAQHQRQASSDRSEAQTQRLRREAAETKRVVRRTPAPAPRPDRGAPLVVVHAVAPSLSASPTEDH